MKTESSPATVATPPIPDELWMLWTGSDWVRSIDPLGEVDALAGADHQNAMYDMDCIPVRVK
jgi:hypothetical protein